MKKINLKDYIRDIPDFPKQGIIFKDITPLLKDNKAFQAMVDAFVEMYKGKKIDSVVAVEARGFILGSAVAYKLGVGLIPVRKKGKLPAKTRSVTYALEYGTDTLEMHHDAISKGDNILVIDDVLATGGTIKAVTDLIKELEGKIIGVAFLMELSFLNGKNKLKDLPIQSLITY